MLKEQKTSFYLHQIIMKCHDILRQYNQENQGCSSMPRLRLLTLLQNKGPLSLKNISAKLSLSAPSLCITLNKLVEEKYAERYVDENDRRNTYYQLLPKGEEYLNKERNNLMDYFDYRLSLLSEEDNHNFREHIMAIHKIMTELPNKQ